MRINKNDVELLRCKGFKLPWYFKLLLPLAIYEHFDKDDMYRPPNCFVYVKSVQDTMMLERGMHYYFIRILWPWFVYRDIKHRVTDERGLCVGWMRPFTGLRILRRHGLTVHHEVFHGLDTDNAHVVKEKKHGFVCRARVS
jgi:hypothetical protein